MTAPNTTLPLIEIERIEELCAKATPLPWQEGVAGHAGLVHFNGDDVHYVMAGQPHNRAFVGALVNNCLALCAEAKRAGELDAALPSDILKMCRHRGWSLDWTHRGAYLHLESSELIEAIRGKHGDPMHEAADVLLVLMSITEYAGIPWSAVTAQARAKCDEMMTRPRYVGEEHSGAALSAPTEEPKA